MPGKRKTWRCFHCDEVFRSRKAAWAHFGSDEDCEKQPPACVDPLRHDERERLNQLREAQAYAGHCQEETNNSEERADGLEMELKEFKRLTKCSSLAELRELPASNDIRAMRIEDAARAFADVFIDKDRTIRRYPWAKGADEFATLDAALEEK